MDSIEQKISDNELEKKAARQRALSLQKRIEKKTGRIRVFLLHEQKYVDVFPTDAREMLEMNAATLEPLEVVNKSGKIKIAPEQLDEYRKKGFRPEAEQGHDENPEKYIEDMKVSELKKYAGDNEIDISGLTRKDDILATVLQAVEDKE